MIHENKWVNGDWKTNDYLSSKTKSFELIDSFLTQPPNQVLDIGCGLAFESEMLQKKYNSNLYLLDGDFETTKDRNRDTKYGDASTLRFYSRVEDLKRSFDQRRLQYSFVDANNINLNENIKFDLVYSNISCGYHYPLNTYADLLKKHTTKDTIMVFDIHTHYWTDQLGDLFEVVDHRSMVGKKILKCQIKFK
jgi:SAM-dependent methyltransferase